MTDLIVGTTTAHKMRFCQVTKSQADTHSPEDGLDIVDVPVTKREWDVTDREARAEAARQELPDPDSPRWAKDAQWFINEAENAAALLIYRTVPQFPDV